jgi:hypothetical protein
MRDENKDVEATLWRWWACTQTKSCFSSLEPELTEVGSPSAINQIEVWLLLPLSTSVALPLLLSLWCQFCTNLKLTYQLQSFHDYAQWMGKYRKRTPSGCRVRALRPWCSSPCRDKDFGLSTPSVPVPGTTQPPLQGVWRLFPPGRGGGKDAVSISW